MFTLKTAEFKDLIHQRNNEQILNEVINMTSSEWLKKLDLLASNIVTDYEKLISHMDVDINTLSDDIDLDVLGASMTIKLNKMVSHIEKMSV